jgi:hypothetical protein
MEIEPSKFCQEKTIQLRTTKIGQHVHQVHTNTYKKLQIIVAFGDEAIIMHTKN